MYVSQSTAFSVHTNSCILLFWLAMLGVGFVSLKNIGMAVARPAPPPTLHTCTHTHMHACTHKRIHERTHTHTHTHTLERVCRPLESNMDKITSQQSLDQI